MIRKTLIMQTSQKYTIWALLRWSGLKFQQLQAPSPPPEPLARRKGGEPHLLFRTVNSAAAVSVVPGRRKGPHQATGPEEDHILLLGIRHSPTCQGKGWRTDLCLGRAKKSARSEARNDGEERLAFRPQRGAAGLGSGAGDSKRRRSATRSGRMRNGGSAREKLRSAPIGKLQGRNRQVCVMSPVPKK
ncbi:uncharacterized protein LOC126064259 isoform X2 [Elephas maximus indicus]|uniref:uncharacterized protein LOC126064259 isoform X2 n=1 Tax=Elephas maximus indicus TaxID=99487 RepID=UPI002116AD74|nr:uncharacterized protein LOC126064259 isoform X2 [Elephas maximus indicus]